MWKTHTPRLTKVLPTKSTNADSPLSAGVTLLPTKLPPLIAGGLGFFCLFFLSAGELCPADKERLHCVPYSGTAVAAQLCRCKVLSVDIALATLGSTMCQLETGAAVGLILFWAFSLELLCSQTFANMWANSAIDNMLHIGKCSVQSNLSKCFAL